MFLPFCGPSPGVSADGMGAITVVTVRLLFAAFLGDVLSWYSRAELFDVEDYTLGPSRILAVLSG